MKMKRYIILCLFLASNAYSYTQQHALVEKLGVQGDSIYFSISLPLLTNCQWNNIYFNNTSNFGKAAYANILAAKSADKKLSRIDYRQAVAGGKCTLSLVEVK